MSARPEWRCFFCDEVFKNPGEAADHFGATQADKPGCLIDYQVQLETGTNTQRGRGLLMALRRAQAELMRYGSEDTDLHRHMHRMECEHRQALIREEEKGYARGLRDGVAAPRGPLTKDEVDALVYQCRQAGDDSTYALVAAIEAAHGVKVRPARLDEAALRQWLVDVQENVANDRKVRDAAGLLLAEAAPANGVAPAQVLSSELVSLLDEVRQCFTRDDDLPGDLLPRIDRAIDAARGVLGTDGGQG